jgi:hypothetical protein
MLGEPTSKRGTEWRYGNHGSLSIDTKRGLWFDHESNEGGGLVDLVERHYGTTMASVADILETDFGIPKQSQTALTPAQKLVARFDYVDDNGEVIYQVERWQKGASKTFKQRRPDGKGGWLYNMQGVEPVPYRLDQILLQPEMPIIVVEGEKCANVLGMHGLVATTNHGGAKNWKPSINKWFEGRNVVILPDNDDAGAKHADLVASNLFGIAKHLKRVTLPGLPEKGDVADWLASGNTVDALIQTMKDAPLIEAQPPEVKTQSNALQTLDMNQLINMPPVDWLVDDMITAHGFSVIYGAPGIGKSFLSIDMSLAIAYGDEWHGRETKKGAVLYIAGEGVGGMGKRVKAWMMHNKKKDITDFHVVPQTVKMLEPEGVEAVIETIESFDVPFRLIVIDTLARTLAATGNDENSATDTGLLIEQCNEIQRRCGVAVLAVAHSGKDAGRGLRGSSAVLGGADTVIGMTGGEGLATIKMEKQKDSEGIEPMHFELLPIALLEDSSAVLVPTEQQPRAKHKSQLSKQQRMVFDILQNEIIKQGRGITQDRWIEVCNRDTIGISASSLTTARTKVFDKNFVKITDGLLYINKELDE